MYDKKILQNEVILDIGNRTYENNILLDDETLLDEDMDYLYNWGFGY
jgi:hypothetical protein